MRLTACALALSLCLTAWGQAFRMARGEAVAIVLQDSTGAPVEAARMLSSDLQRILDAQVALEANTEQTPLNIPVNKTIIVGTNERAFQPHEHQAYRLRAEGTDRLIIEGSDALGTAFGCTTLSRLLGVSPWEWWTEVESLQRDSFSLDTPIYSRPYVEHRGIFINDEDWGLAPWATRRQGGREEGSKWKYTIGPEVTERLCQLLLRLKADTYWPAMHECSQPFFLIEGNREVVARYGIHIGTSHCEPLACNAAGEWAVRGTGDYDYKNNGEAVRRFWQQRLDSVAGQPIIYTLGMRGLHDGAMQGAKTAEERRDLLQQIIADQRGMLSSTLARRIEDIPQVFIPYKEVLDAMNAGLHVPDDVPIMQCDDNYGYIRWPEDSILARPAGNGLYYHVSYWGRPHDYLWLSTTHPAVMQEELTRFAQSGRQQVWVLNVGDLKPAEYQTQLFMDIAWNPKDFSTANDWRRHLTDFLRENLHRDDVEGIVTDLAQWYDLMLRCRPEFLAGTRTEERDERWKHPSDLPWTLEEMTAYRDSLAAIASRTKAQTLTEYQLVAYPLLASAQMAGKHVAATLARHGMGDWQTSDMAHDSIQALTALYNQGRWDGFMDAAPRRLPVFQRVEHTTAEGSLPREGDYVLDTTLGNTLTCLGEGQTLSFDVETDKRTDSLAITLDILPTHPRHGEKLTVGISVDGGEEAVCDLTTYDRSEQWKRNVLANAATTRVTLKTDRRRRHTISIVARSGGEVFPLRLRVGKL